MQSKHTPFQIWCCRIGDWIPQHPPLCVPWRCGFASSHLRWQRFPDALLKAQTQTQTISKLTTTYTDNVTLPAFTRHAAVCRAAFDRYLQLAASTAAKLQQRVCCCVPCSIRSISPTGRIHSSKATAAGVGPCWNRRTDGQPTDVYRPCSTYYVGTADKQTVLQIQVFQLGSEAYYISVVLAQVHSGICL